MILAKLLGVLLGLTTLVVVYSIMSVSTQCSRYEEEQEWRRLMQENKK